MQTKWTQPQAYELLKQYNQDAFHLRHGRTVEEVMRCFARELGYGEEEDFWGIVGLLHDLDFEQYPDCLLYTSVGRAADEIRKPVDHIRFPPEDGDGLKCKAKTWISCSAYLVQTADRGMQRHLVHLFRVGLRSLVDFMQNGNRVVEHLSWLCFGRFYHQSLFHNCLLYTS